MSSSGQSPAVMGPTTFFDLPPELRNAIYAQVIDFSSRGVITLKGVAPRTSALTKSETIANNRSQNGNRTSLLLSCKRAYNETLPMFLAAHRIRITHDAWPRISTMSNSHRSGIQYLIVDKSTPLSSTLSNASTFPSLQTLDIRIPNFRFGKAKHILSKGFPALRQVYVSDPRLKAMAEHFALEDDEQTLAVDFASSSRVYSVEDFQTWRGCWDKVVSLKVVDQGLGKEVEERMAGMVVTKLF